MLTSSTRLWQRGDETDVLTMSHFDAHHKIITSEKCFPHLLDTLIRIPLSFVPVQTRFYITNRGGHCYLVCAKSWDDCAVIDQAFQLIVTKYKQLIAMACPAPRVPQISALPFYVMVSRVPRVCGCLPLLRPLNDVIQDFLGRIAEWQEYESSYFA